MMNIDLKKQTRVIKENLFSSPVSTLLTFLTSYIMISFFRGMFGFATAPDKDWLSVLNNMQLYMVQAYPESDFIRIWICVGLGFIFSGLSVGLWETGEKTSLSKLCLTFSKIIFGIIFLTLIAPTTSVIVSTATGIREQVDVFSYAERIPLLSILLGLLVVFFLLSKINLNFNKSFLVSIYLFVPIVFLWLMKIPTIKLDAENQRVFPDPLMPIANSTKIPWTLIWMSFVAAYLIGIYFKNKKQFKTAVSISWVLLPLLIFSWIFKKPLIDLNELIRNDIPVFIGFLLVGVLTIYFINNKIVEKFYGYYLGLLVIVTLASLFLKVILLVKAGLLLLLLFSVIIPAVSTSAKGKRSLTIVWIVSLTTTAFLLEGGTSTTQIVVPGSSIFGGFSLTWLLAIFGTYVSFPLGVLLALGRNSSLPIIKGVCTGIIELVRSVPYITWLFFASVTMAVFLPDGVEFNLIVRVLIVTAFFSGAYFAENIRGGLQSIPKGQFEAADAIGMNTVQKTSLIVLPQALRAIVPTLVSSIITGFKDSSLVTIIGLFDFLTIGRMVIGNQSIPINFIGHDRENLLFIALVYWIFTFTLSRRSMKFEKRLGLGER
ncbi:amino acid ABC transporter permease [Acidimicrobiaceae bacterium]|nr:amino acid ABC transporter permease [Acidimicrobiaceae bacterium]